MRAEDITEGLIPYPAKAPLCLLIIIKFKTQNRSLGS